MKNWLKNLQVRQKLNLMISISLAGLILLGLAANSLVRMTKITNIMLAAQREYMVNYHKALGFFYQYQAGDTDVEQDTSYLDSAINLLITANQSLKPFSDIDQFLSIQPRDKQVDSLRSIYQNALMEYKEAEQSGEYDSIPDSDLKNARFLLNRFRLINNIQKKAFKPSEKATKESLLVADSILEYFRNNASGDAMNAYQNSQLQEKLKEMESRELTYQKNVSALSRKLLLTLTWIVVIIVVLFVGIVWFFSGMISRFISQPVREISSHLKAISIGDLSGESTYQSRDEIGDLADSYRGLQQNIREQVDQARRVAEGNLEGVLEPKSPKDSMSLALNEMTRSLREADRKNRQEDWLKTRINELSNELRGDLDLQSLGYKTTTYLCNHLGALTGALFIRDQHDRMVFAGGHAVITRLIREKTFAQGEGLVGQAWQNKEAVQVNGTPNQYMSVYSGLGETVPTHLMVMPCKFNEEVFGVVELGSLKPFQTEKLQLLEKVSEGIAIAISTARSRSELEQLLKKQQELTEKLQVQQEELRQTNEELQVQQEELRQANEELEAQTRELEESKASLQAQQEELRVTNEELAERTRAIEQQRDNIKKTNAELEAARQEIEKKARDLEQASRYKSEFMANMSHELRTPLNSILVLSQILSQNKPGNLNEKQVKSVETIHSSGENLLTLINEILDLSKIESGRIDLHPEFIRLDQLAEDLNNTFRPIAGEKKLHLEIVNRIKDLESIETDNLRTQQILRNLLANAIKFTEKGSVTVTLTRPDQVPSYLVQDRKYVAFRVQDTGIGIAANKLDLVFEAFRQADGTTTRKYGGTGLGLAISRNFARLMGGDILAESAEHAGSTFTLLLPDRMYISKVAQKAIESARKVAGTDQSATDQMPGISSEPVPSGYPEQRQTPAEIPLTDGLAIVKNADLIQDDRKYINQGDTFLLIIEDDTAFSQVLYDLAHEKNFKCMIAPNGETGLHYADYYGPSAIILDIGLPGIDGWEVMKRLKENPNTRHIPVHFMSAADKSMEAMKKGAIGFLKKPVSVEQVNQAFDTIEDIISKPVKKLLIVEDDEGMQNSLRELIGEDNIHILTAGSGQMALDLLARESFDCMILDLGLEDMTGHELLKKLGKKGVSQDMPVIIYTGKDLTREEEEKLRSYSDRIIIKGIKSPERLLAETTLFLHQVESSLPAEKQQMLRKTREKGDVMKDKTILIVDDDMRNVFALTSLLEDLGVKIVVGKNGREGVEKLQQSKIDLILMDIMMPEMNGYEAMEVIRSKKKYEKLPIIALTAKAMPGDREKCMQAGANDYLTKPIDSDKLISLLRVWLYQ